MLSLFPGIGLLDMAFEEEGFCVVRGPDLLWGGDVKRFHPPAGRFDGVIGGPPCQAFSTLAFSVRAQGRDVKPNLIPEFERVVAEAKPAWFVMENVMGAPMAIVPEYGVTARVVHDVAVGGATRRKRRFTFGRHGAVRTACDFYVPELALHNAEPEYAILARGPQQPRIYKGKRKVSRNSPNAAALAHAIRVQGLPDDFLADAQITVAGKYAMVGNGVPLPMGRAIAQAVKRAMYPEMQGASA